MTRRIMRERMLPLTVGISPAMYPPAWLASVNVAPLRTSVAGAKGLRCPHADLALRQPPAPLGAR
jgi:hypothetical protein